MKEKKTDVLFRVLKGTAQDKVFALFPYIPSSPGMVMAFDSLESHCPADYYAEMSRSVPASEEHYDWMYKVLTNEYSYDLRVIKRVNRMKLLKTLNCKSNEKQ